MTSEALATSSVLLFAAAEWELMVASANLVKAALASPVLFFTLRRQLLTIAIQTAQRLQQSIPAIVRRVIGSAPRTLFTQQVESGLTTALNSAVRRVPQFAEDAYRAAFMEASFRMERGESPFSVTQGAWRRLMGQGITGFTDSRGHSWNLASYAEMAVRTATARMFRYTDQQRMLQQGISLFLVSHDGRPCPNCAPWEGIVLSAFPGQGFPTVDEATSAGLFHPNCLHTLTGYVPGRAQTQPPTPWTPEMERRYRATQRQRRLERELRAARQQRDGAISASDRATARLRIAALERQMEILVRQYGLQRQRRRESPNLGFH